MNCSCLNDTSALEIIPKKNFGFWERNQNNTKLRMLCEMYIGNMYIIVLLLFRCLNLLIGLEDHITHLKSAIQARLNFVWVFLGGLFFLAIRAEELPTNNTFILPRENIYFLDY